MSTIEQQATGTFAADPVHSHVGFEVPYAVATFSGEVTDFTATLVDGHLEGSAKIDSIRLKDENLTAHVLSPEFFDAECHPVLTKLETVVDRTAFDMKWNMPLPNGEPALGNEVTLKADLTLVAQEA